MLSKNKLVLIIILFIPLISFASSHMASHGHISFPKDMGFILLNPDFRQTLHALMKKEGIAASTLRQVIRKPLSPTLEFVFTETTRRIGTKIIIIEVQLLNTEEGFLIQKMSSFTNMIREAADIVVLESNILDVSDVVDSVLSSEFQENMKGIQEQMGSLETMIYGIEKCSPSEVERAKGIEAVYRIDIGNNKATGVPEIVRVNIGVGEHRIGEMRAIREMSWNAVEIIPESDMHSLALALEKFRTTQVPMQAHHIPSETEILMLSRRLSEEYVATIEVKRSLGESFQFKEVIDEVTRKERWPEAMRARILEEDFLVRLRNLKGAKLTPKSVTALFVRQLRKMY